MEQGKREQKSINSSYIIPAIDIIDGKCVRLTKGNFSEQTIYSEHPADVAREFEDAGIQRLHLVDLDGAKNGKVSNWKILEEIAGKTKLKIDFGGGLNSIDDVRTVFDSGATWAAVGSIAVKERAKFMEWIKTFGGERFLLGADVKNERIAVRGWQEMTELTVYDLIGLYSNAGIKEIFCTDVSRDGMLEGPSIELYKEIIEKFPGLNLIASGGVSHLEDVRQLAEVGCSGVIIGKAIYEGRIKIREFEKIIQPN